MKQSIELKDYDLLTEKQKTQLKEIVFESMPDLGFSIPLMPEIICNRCTIGLMFGILQEKLLDDNKDSDMSFDFEIAYKYETGECNQGYMWEVTICKETKMICESSFVPAHEEGKRKNKVYIKESGNLLDGIYEEKQTVYQYDELCDALFYALRHEVLSKEVI